MPGGMMCLSSDGVTPNTAVLWACIPYLDANTAVSPGRLLAYDATALGTFADGSKRLRVLWDSQELEPHFQLLQVHPVGRRQRQALCADLPCARDVYGLA
jgi:hypothetical protein